MFRFKTAQKTFQIGKVKVGGQPGENPPALIGSIFYSRHRILLDEKKGEINKEIATQLIRKQEELSGRTGIPGMLDVVGVSPEAMRKLISFVAEVTDMSFLIDSPFFEVKIAGLRHAKEIGLEERVVYNSLTGESTEEEYEALRTNEVESAVLLAYKSGFMTSAERVKTIENMLSRAEKAGVPKPLVDTFVLDLPSLGQASRSLLELKKRFGVPCGCGAHNAISTWKGLKENMGIEAVTPSAVTVNVLPIVLGGDFVFYGPIELCTHMFASVHAVHTCYRFLRRVKESMEL